VAGDVTSAQERLEALTSWHHDWSGLRVAVYGLGVTGFSVADTLAELGAQVLVVTSRADTERAMLLEVIGAGRSRPAPGRPARPACRRPRTR
jgi:UDP-N-acetylmuramoylalanine--D-glutamate ligase